MAESSYTFVLDDAELARYRSMATRAVEAEGELWRRAGIQPGAHVIDLGCGPGAFLPELAALVAPGGLVVGVDQDAGAMHGRAGSWSGSPYRTLACARRTPSHRGSNCPPRTSSSSATC